MTTATPGQAGEGPVRPYPRRIRRLCCANGARPDELWEISPEQFVRVTFEDWSFNPGGAWRPLVVRCQPNGMPFPIADISLGCGQWSDDALRTTLADPDVIKALFATASLTTGIRERRTRDGPK